MIFSSKRPVALAASAFTAFFLSACPAPEVEPPDLNGGFAFGKVAAFIGGSPIVGAEICMKDSELCGETQEDGSFEVEGLPADTDVVLTFDHRDYFPATGMWNTSRKDDAWNYTLPKEDELGLQISFADQEVERGKGQIFFAARVEKGTDKDGVPGISLDADSELGDVIYGNSLGLPDVALTETSAAGNGIFVNVEPGEYSFALNGVNCEPYFSMNKDADGRYPVHVFSNTLSAVTVVCE